MTSTKERVGLVAVIAAMAACSIGGTTASALFDDAGRREQVEARDEADGTDDTDVDDSGGARDAGKDSGKKDAGVNDSGGKDAGPVDSGSKDSGGPPATATGLQGFCEHYFECGGTSYASVQACVTDAVNYWNACRRPELDAFGTCMMQVSCQDWNPAAYDPYATPCGTLWGTMVQKNCP